MSGPVEVIPPPGSVSALPAGHAWSPPGGVLVCELWQRTSARGTEYLSGFLGKARVIGFRGPDRPDGTPVWRVFLTPGKDQEGGR